MSQNIKVGVIGVGYLGHFHAQKYAAMENVELVGVADSNLERAREIAKEVGTTAFGNYQDMLPQVDAVSVVVPTSLHHEVAKACLQARLDIMLEKPITTTLGEADDLIALAKKQGCLIQVGHLERFNPAVQAMRPLLTRPLLIEAHRLTTFRNRGTDVDVVLDLMIHDIDIILSIVDSPLVNILTAGAPVITKHTDIANARLLFANGCSANITASRISPESVRRMRVFQPGCLLSVDYAEKQMMTSRLNPQTDGSINAPEITQYAIPNQDALDSQLRDFIVHVRERSQPLVNGEAGRRALDVALQVVEQIQAGNDRLLQILADEGRDDLLPLMGHY